MIELKDWKVTVPHRENVIGYERDHLARRLEIQVDLGPEWAVKLDLRKGAAVNVIDLERDGDVCYVDLTRDMLGESGLYSAQLRGLRGEVVAHSNIFPLYISDAINGVDAFPPLAPSELAQLEERMTQAKNEAQSAAERAETAAERAAAEVIARFTDGNEVSY